MRKVSNNTPAYIDYDVFINFAGYAGADRVLTVFAKAGATEKEILKTVVDDCRNELFEGEVIDFDGFDGYIIKVTFTGFLGTEVSAEYEVYADSEDEAIENAIYDATFALTVTSFAE